MIIITDMQNDSLIMLILQRFLVSHRKGPMTQDARTRPRFVWFNCTIVVKRLATEDGWMVRV